MSSSLQAQRTTLLEQLQGMPSPAGASVGEALAIQTTAPFQAAWTPLPFLPLAGGTMSGAIDMADNEINNANDITFAANRRLEFLQTPSLTGIWIRSRASGDAFDRYFITVAGRHQWGPGTGGADVLLERGPLTGIGNNNLELEGGWLVSNRAVVGGPGFMEVRHEAAHANPKVRIEAPTAAAEGGRLLLGLGDATPLDWELSRIPSAPGVAQVTDGSFAAPVPVLDVAVSGLTVVADHIEQVFVDTAATGGTATIDIGNPDDGRTVNVKDTGANASVNDIDVSSTANIEGAVSPFNMATDGIARTFRGDGVEWWAIGGIN